MTPRADRQDDAPGAWPTAEEQPKQQQQQPQKPNTGQEEPPDWDTEPGYRCDAVRPSYYVALRLGRQRPCLRIDSLDGAMRFIEYSLRMEMLFEDVSQTSITIFFRTCTVVITGANLWPVAHSISRGVCDSIYRYHPDFYPAPPHEGDPVIYKIEVLSPQPPSHEKADGAK